MEPPPFRDDLGRILAEAWRLLADAAAGRSAPMRTPVLATVRADGRPAARTVVLRAVDVAAQRLLIHTDSRSAKVAEIRVRPLVALHAYDPAALVQLRLDGRAVCHAGDALADRAWRDSPPPSRALYRVEPGPGQAIADPSAVDPDAADRRDGDEPAAGRANFLVLEIAVERLEWLHLAPAGHRRAAFRWRGAASDGSGKAIGRWLVP